jgi:hypothetical protein
MSLTSDKAVHSIDFLAMRRWGIHRQVFQHYVTEPKDFLVRQKVNIIRRIDGLGDPVDLMCDFN